MQHDNCQTHQLLHYRIINRIISTNTFLFKIGKSESPLCTFCKEENETLYHILWECEKVKNFIEEIIGYIKDNYNIILRLTAQSWFFPRIGEESKLSIIIITIAKQAVFQAKHKNNTPNINQFIALLKIEAEKEQISSIRNNKNLQFLEKWGSVSKILSDTQPTPYPIPQPSPHPINPCVRDTSVAGVCRRGSGGRHGAAPVARRPFRPAHP